MKLARKMVVHLAPLQVVVKVVKLDEKLVVEKVESMVD